MAAKKTTQKAADTKDPNQGEDPKQQELGQGGQSDSGEQANGSDQAQGAKPEQDDGNARAQDPEQQVSPVNDGSEELDPDADQEVFVLVDYNPLGLKCATVATVSVADARHLEKQGIVDTADEAVARGKGSKSTSAGADQVIEDDD